MESLSAATFFAPHVLLVVATIGAVASYLRPVELRISPILGFGGIAGLLLFVLFFGVWSGYPTRADLNYFSIGGFVPHSDAAGYYIGSFAAGYTGRWDWIPSTRPIAAALRDVVAGLGGLYYRPSLVVQALFVSAAITFAAWRVSLWMGTWSALAFTAFTAILARPFLGNTATEPLGLVWSLVAIGFLADALRTRSFSAALLAIFCTSMSQMTRMGAVFIVPALMLWGIVTFWERGRVVRNIALICSAAASPLIINWILAALYGAPNIPSGWNASLLLCGLARGTTWYECRDTLVAAGVTQTDIAAFASALYRLAWDSFTSDPRIFFATLWANVRGFLNYAPMQMIGGINLHLGVMTPYSDLMMLMALPGLLLHLWRAPRSEWVLWPAGAAAITAGAAFLWSYDSWRVLYSTHAFIALFLCIGWRSFRPPADSPAINARTALASLAIVIAIMLATPGLLHATLATARSSDYDGRSVAGFLLIADDAPAPSKPYLRAAQFERVMEITKLEDENGPFIQPTLMALPRSVFFAAQRGHRSQGTLWFIGPPEIILRDDVSAWRFSFLEPEWKKKGTPLRIIKQAEPR